MKHTNRLDQIQHGAQWKRRKKQAAKSRRQTKTQKAAAPTREHEARDVRQQGMQTSTVARTQRDSPISAYLSVPAVHVPQRSSTVGVHKARQ